MSHRAWIRAVVAVAALAGSISAQETPTRTPRGKTSDTGALDTGALEPRDEPETAPRAPPKVEVQPVAADEEIRARLERILEATGWFANPQVRVDEGVVFLAGRTPTDQHKKWAGELASNTRDVVAVVNQIEITGPPTWDFQATGEGLHALWRDVIGSFPFVIFGLFILLLAYGASLLTSRGMQKLLRRQVDVPLLRTVVARTAAAVIFLLGLYIVLKISGLTRLAVTVLGGTGLMGLVIGIAFRDITENFLASVLLSIQRPFRAGDLVEVESHLGYVQQLNVRTTVLMNLSGNHVQIPNATVYKSTIRNYTSNPNRREDFTVGVSYDVQIPDAQEVALRVLAEHSAVLKDPEPWVLVDSLGPATVNLRVYFWLNGSRHSWLKVRSSVIRLVKRAFQDEGIAMPDEAREIVFPRGVPVRMVRDAAAETQRSPTRVSPPETKDVEVAAEGGLRSEAEQIEKQARQSRPPEAGDDLLRTAQ